MYKQKIKIILMISMILVIPTNLFAFDLLADISSTFSKYYYGGSTDDYMNEVYSSDFSSDPFMDSLESLEDIDMQTKVEGVKMIENALLEYNCSMPVKKIWGILYYFSADFRSDISYKIKKSVLDKNQLMLSDSDVLQYCTEYYYCGNIYDKGDKNIITATTPKDVMTNCKEFFTYHYSLGQKNAKDLQSVKTAQLGADKYWNASTEDSPYDIMSDFKSIGTLMFKDVDYPTDVVFYSVPNFSNTTKSLLEESLNSEGEGQGNSSTNKKSDSTNVGSNANDGGNTNAGNGTKGGDASNSNGNSDENQGGNLMKTLHDTDEELYDFLEDGLGVYRLGSSSLTYGSKCAVNDEQEVEEETEKKISENSENGTDFRGLTEEEYEIMADYVINAVNDYGTLDEDTQNEVESKKPDLNQNLSASETPDDEKIVESIKNCWTSCEGLRLDQKLSCQIMCACDQYDSPVFDPEKNPGLGPIFMIRFCTVPAQNTTFSVGGTKIVSIEEGINEIYGVVDKLEREGKLGIWTQQHNFLDSSTKKMKLLDMIAFTINVEFVDITEKKSSESTQFGDSIAKSTNKLRQGLHHISNSLNSDITKNRYRVVSFLGETVNDYSAEYNADKNRQDQEKTYVESDIKDDTSVSDRYYNLSEFINFWTEQQGAFWIQATEYINQWIDIAKMLYLKK